MRSPDAVVETAVSGNVVTTAEAQAHVGVPEAAGTPASLDLIIQSAQDVVDGPESETGWSYRRRTLEASLRGSWPSPRVPILLPPPVNPSSLSVVYGTLSGDMEALPSSMVEHYVEDRRHYVELEEPGDYGGRSLTVSYTTADSPAPAGVKIACLAIIAWLFRHRDSLLGPDAGQAKENPEIRRILEQYRISRIVV